MKKIFTAIAIALYFCSQLLAEIPGHLDYPSLVEQLKTWNKQNPTCTTVDTYGKSTKGKDLYYFKLSTQPPTPKRKVLITACIHGNESLSCGVLVAYLSILLDKKNTDVNIANILNKREFYFIPVVCPDSYPNDRYSDGADPNRNFPTLKNPNKKSVTAIEALKSFFQFIQPHAVISGHTYGREVLQPFGYTNDDPPNDSDFTKILGKAAQSSNYQLLRASDLYGEPILGSELDYYYQIGAFNAVLNWKVVKRGAFTCVIEYGTHQRIPTLNEIKSETTRTWNAFLTIADQGADVDVVWQKDVLGNTVRQLQRYWTYKFKSHPER